MFVFNWMSSDHFTRGYKTFIIYNYVLMVFDAPDVYTYIHTYRY